MRLFHQKTYSFLWRFGLRRRTQQSFDLPKYLVNCGLMNIKPRSQFFFQLSEFTRKNPLLNKHLPHTNKRKVRREPICGASDLFVKSLGRNSVNAGKVRIQDNPLTADCYNQGRYV